MPDKDLRLLALDGGGVRGVSALIILQQLMETIDSENPPKPCDYFDMIGGTSTGGLIAIMLGRLKMSIDDCIDAYLSLSDRIFQKKRYSVTVKGNIQGRFDSEELVQAVKEVVAAQKLNEDALLKDVSDNACRVFVCATSKETSETICLSSYKSARSSSDLLNSVKIWEACRATSAASSFFDPITIGRFGEEFVDGATGANNPVWEVWNQAQLLWGPQPLECKLKCLVSIGTGVPSLQPFRDDILHIGETLVSIATETERTAERFHQNKAHLDDSGQYYRFNVDRGLEEIGLEESKKRKEIAAATRRYVGLQGVFRQMQACAGNLRGQNNYESSDLTKHYAAFFPKAGRRTISGQELIDAASDGDHVLVEELLKKGVDVNSKDIAGATPFYYATSQGHPAVVKLLLETGKAKVDLKYPASMTPLFHATQGGHVEVVQLLLQTGKVDVNVKGPGGMTPLFHATQGGDVEVVQLLLQTGKVDVNARGPGGVTPLSFTAMQGNEAMVRTFLESGKADVNIKDFYGKTALTWATEAGHKDVVKLLQPASSYS